MGSSATPYLQVVKASRDLLFEFLDHIHISGTVRARNFNFDMHIGHQGHYERNAKYGQRGSGRVHVT